MIKKRLLFGLLAAALNCTVPVQAWAQAAAEAGGLPGTDSSAQSASTAATSTWIAGLNGGYVDRSAFADSPYAAFSLTRYRKQAYLRAAFTVYRSTLTQVDAALPSTYYIGSLGAGGNFNNWVIDAHLSYGRQVYGPIETDLGKRQSTFVSTGYAAAGLRVGRVFQPARHWSLTPTVSAEYVATKSLRHRVELGRAIDFELAERTFTGAATLRLDRTFGKDEQSYLGAALSHFETTNGATRSVLLSGGAVTGAGTPDSWQQFELSGTLRLRPGLWLDGQVQRSFGAVAGDNTTVGVGVRFKL